MNFRAIPVELRERHQWVAWAYEEHDGRQTKVPRQVTDLSRPASSTAPRTWARFDRAALVLEAAGPTLGGIGYVLSAEDPFVGLDLDLCVDEQRRVHPEAQEIVDRLGGYAELSPSERGIRIIVRGALRGKRRSTKKVPWAGFVELDGRDAEFAIYDQGRFLTLTGNQ